jgi:lipopolysaccharide transport system ATP-binding protein
VFVYEHQAMSIKSIEVLQLSKRFQIGALQENTPRPFSQVLLETLKEPWRRIQSLRKNSLPQFADESIWAVKEVSFDLEEGEVVGIIGRNGAGKSTLLKILARITPPTSGKAILRGRVASLLEVGTGFNGELTGRENVYLNGSILGMRKEEIDRQFDDIVAFAGVEKFIDTPIKRYSSGMGVRLGFAVAAHLQPEILLVDEVLAVGDLEFQKKCLSKLDSVGQSGRTVLFVSHQMDAILKLCPRTIWIDQGGVRADGPTERVVNNYIEESIGRSRSIDFNTLSGRFDRQGGGRLRLTGVELRDGKGQPIMAAILGQDLQIALGFQAHEDLEKVTAKLYLKNKYNRAVLILSTHYNNLSFQTGQTRGELLCHVPRFPLAPENYLVDIEISSAQGGEDHIREAFSIEVLEGDFFRVGRYLRAGEFYCEHQWQLQIEAPNEHAKLVEVS